MRDGLSGPRRSAGYRKGSYNLFITQIALATRKSEVRTRPSRQDASLFEPRSTITLPRLGSIALGVEFGLGSWDAKSLRAELSTPRPLSLWKRHNPFSMKHKKVFRGHIQSFKHSEQLLFFILSFRNVSLF